MEPQTLLDQFEESLNKEELPIVKIYKSGDIFYVKDASGVVNKPITGMGDGVSEAMINYLNKKEGKEDA